MQNMSLVLLLVVVCGATLSEGLSLGRGSLSMIGSKKKVCCNGLGWYICMRSTSHGTVTTSCLHLIASD